MEASTPMPARSEGAVETARGFKAVGYCDIGGRPDGTQVMVHRGYAYVAHPFSGGFSVVDVRNPREPNTVRFVPTPPNSWTLGVQSHADMLLAVEEFDFYSVYNRETDYYSHSIEGVHSSKFGKRGVDYSAGLRIYDISSPDDPRPIGFLEVEGLGLHRSWWVGDRYAYASAVLDGYTDHVLAIIDLADPTKPELTGVFALPGMWTDGGETPTWTNRVALHHALVAGDVAYSAWRDGGFAMIDLSDRSKPRLISHLNWCPPYAGGTHSCLPLTDRGLCVVADEAVGDIAIEPLKFTWILDIRAPENPVTIATLPTPSDQDYFSKGWHFGPHNLWENRPGAFQSSETIFATYQNAGVRAFDIANQYQPKELGWFVPGAPEAMVDPRPDIPQILHTVDLYVEDNGLTYVVGFNDGLHIAEWTGNTSD